MSKKSSTFVADFKNTKRKGIFMGDFETLLDYLKGLADRANAGKAYIEWTFEDGGCFRLEYKPEKRRTK